MGKTIEPTSSSSSSSSSSSTTNETAKSSSSLLTNNPNSGSSTRYGTLPSNFASTSSGFKRTMLIDTRYPRTYFTRKQFLIAAISMLLFIAAVTVTLIFGLPRLKAKREEYFAARFYESPLPEVLHSKFAILVSDNEYPSCADAGREMLLNRNGSAMDAALASLFCLTMASPHLVGLDSGFRGLVHSDQKTYTFDVMERSFPLQQQQQQEKFNSTTKASLSYPVLPMAAEQLWRNFGKVSWPTILMPSIWLAENGAPISEHFAQEIHANQNRLLSDFKIIRDHFIRSINSTERLLNDGELYKNPSLATLFRSISANRSMALFQQNYVDEINQFLNETISIEQLRSFLSKTEMITIDEPFIFSMFDSRLNILTGSLKNSNEAISLAFMMKILEKLTYNEINSDSNYFCHDEDDLHERSLKEGALEFQYLLDTIEFGATALAKLRARQSNESYLLNQSYIDQIAKQIAESTAKKINQRDPDYFDIKNSLIQEELVDREKSVAHNVQIIVYDGRTGDVVTLTTSKRRSMFNGKHKFISKFTGIVYDIFNDNDDTIAHSQVSWPLLIKDVQQEIIHLIIGSVGGRGSLQTLSSAVQVLNKILLNCQTLKSSLDESRLFYRPPDKFFYESNFPRAYIDLLIRMFDRQNLWSTDDKRIVNNQQLDNDDDSTNRLWPDSGVYAMMMMMVTTENVTKNIENSIQQPSNKLRSMIDYRMNGYISGQ
ncbi:gamma-glutamyltransferase 5a-like protein [Euroglyphus maynei]|uniref:Gamma-glutamyltransferase 5a-like protein n=1 Tax=Euroglyphus maynei TaxID=6958 RepID=A0A1Y3BHC5_EURMA|nr:gamma-glutamyltransferase 5a-like protein [Euroglyphus maynei]